MASRDSAGDDGPSRPEYAEIPQRQLSAPEYGRACGSGRDGRELRAGTGTQAPLCPLLGAQHPLGCPGDSRPAGITIRRRPRSFMLPQGRDRAQSEVLRANRAPAPPGHHLFDPASVLLAPDADQRLVWTRRQRVRGTPSAQRQPPPRRCPPAHAMPAVCPARSPGRRCGQAAGHRTQAEQRSRCVVYQSAEAGLLGKLSMPARSLLPLLSCGARGGLHLVPHPVAPMTGHHSPRPPGAERRGSCATTAGTLHRPRVPEDLLIGLPGSHPGLFA